MVPEKQKESVPYLTLSLWSKNATNRNNDSNLAEEGLVSGVLLVLLPRALLLCRLVQTGDSGLQGHRRGRRLVCARCIAADGAAGV